MTVRLRLAAGLAVIALEALGLGVGLAHVFTVLRAAIPLVAFAVIHLRGVIDPHHARAATRCLGCSGLRRLLFGLLGLVRGRRGRIGGGLGVALCVGLGRALGVGLCVLRFFSPPVLYPFVTLA